MTHHLAAAVLGGLVVACGWLTHAVVLLGQLGTWRTDPVTGLPVRRAFYRRAGRAIRRRDTVVLFVDLDRFKPVNDSFGHDVGNEVLAEIGVRLRTCLGRRGAIGRLGGDEFAAAVRLGPVDSPWTDTLAGLVRHLNEPIAIPGQATLLTVGVSVGAVHLNIARDPALPTALHLAESQMYRAKRSGGGLAAVVADPAAPSASWQRSSRPAQRRRDSQSTVAPRHRST